MPAKKQIEIGDLDQRILLQSLIETNVEGALQQAWSTDSPPDQMWAMVTPLPRKSNEVIENARLTGKEMIDVTVRYRTDITIAWRLTWNGVVYGIKTVDHSARRQGWLMLFAEAVT